MLRRLALRDIVIVAELELEFGPGFTVLTGETGAGKSILVDALQLALGARAEASLVREGAPRAEVSAEFDLPRALAGWHDEAGFPPAEDERLLLRRVVDAGGGSRAWINGSAATAAQLREASQALLDIHGQHAWQGLTRPAAVRALLDTEAGVDSAALAAAHAAWRRQLSALDDARNRGETLGRERERLAWQIGELDKLAPGDGEWDALDAEHRRLAHGQALIDAGQQALAAITAAGEGEPVADALIARAADALVAVQAHDPALASPLEALRGALAQVEDAAHSLHAYLGRADPDPAQLAELDARLSAWVSLARRYRRPPAELPELLQGWRDELAALESAADHAALEAAAAQAEQAWRAQAAAASSKRRQAAPVLARAVTAAMSPLGMQAGRFEVVLLPQDAPQSYGLEGVELHVATNPGSTPRPLAKVASGGELSRLALAIAVTTTARSVPTLIFDEIDAGVGGTVADSVGRLMKRLGARAQVLAVTHLAQVAACADSHFVVSKSAPGGATVTEVHPVHGELRVAEIARMLGGDRLAPETSRAHASAMLGAGKP